MTSTQTRAAGAADLARRIAAGDLTATEAVEAHIARLREVAGLNALVVERFDEARAEAAAADAAGGPRGPLHGVPVTIKEQFLVEGTPTTLGVRSRLGHRAAADGPLVARLRAAGAIVLGKSNVSQLLTYHESDNPAYGRTLNPWSAERTPGGSSGGEAALVAAGASPLGLAGDMGGSTRVPAHFSGVHGFKPTTGRLTTLDTPAEFRISGQEAISPQNGPLARTVEDLTLALSVLVDPADDDPLVPPVPWRSPDGVDVAGLRVAVYDDDGFFPAAPAIRRATREAAAALAAAGAVVTDWTPPRAGDAVALALALFASDGGVTNGRFLGDDERAPQVRMLMGTAGLPAFLRPGLAAVAELAGQPRLAATLRDLRPRSAAGHWALLAARSRYREEFSAALEGFDLIVCPPHALPALRHGTSGMLAAAAGYSMLYNLLGLPAGVLSTTRVRPGEESDRPVRRDAVDRAARAAEEGSAGLPVGVQFVGRPWREDVVLAAMAAVEAAVKDDADYPATALPPH